VKAVPYAWTLAALLLVGPVAHAADSPWTPQLRPPIAKLSAPAQRVMDDLTGIVARRDINALKKHIARDTTFSFGGDAGLDGFGTVWSPQERSDLWRELERVLALAAVEQSAERVREICAPYVYCRYPDDQEVFETAAVTGARVAVRSAPRADARLIGRVDYAILPIATDRAADELGWQAVDYRGSRGYVRHELIRSPVDYRLSLRFDAKGRWTLMYFVAGD
jgi:hypothetical protein